MIAVTDYEGLLDFLREDGHEPVLKWEVCPACEGRAYVPLQGIAITADEWHEWSLEERDDYRSGAYDRPCYLCDARSTVKVLDPEQMTEGAYSAAERYVEVVDEMNAISAMERRMGA